jgi:putative membrane protein
MAGLIAHALRVVRADVSLIGRFRMLRLAVLAVALEPAIYALICLSSVWDPAARTRALPVALVNLDAGIEYRHQYDNVGHELGEALMRRGIFGWRSMPDAESARQAVKSGELAFAVVIPVDFSAQAVPGAVAGGGEIRVILSEGNNYAAAGLARHFAEGLGHQVNETLNEKRWKMVLASADGSQNGVVQLKAGVKQLRAGATSLTQGAGQYSAAAAALSEGVRQMATGVRAMESGLPAEPDLKALTSGSRQLLAGQRELGQGLEPLQAGANRLANGARQMQEQSESVPFFGDQLSEGAGELAAGAGQLGDGLGRARKANEQLTQGATQLDGGIVRLTNGVSALGDGVRTLAAHLPADEKLEAFAAGGKALSQGTTRLLEGIKRLDAALPATLEKPEGSADGLAGSVKPVLENLAPVLNNGSAYAPNLVALALWIGAVMAGYLFNLSQMPASLMDLSRPAQALGKFLVPAALALVQALLAFLMLVHGLGLRVASEGDLLLTMAVTSLVFLAMLFALLRVFGEAGKLLSVLFLTLQLAAGGGVIPVELSGGLFQTVHAWLPFTWVIKAFRASLFGAYDHGWAAAMGVIVLAGAVSLLLATFVGRWRFVPDAEHRPGIET